MNYTSPKKNLRFLEGSGEIGELIRAKDWARTSINIPDQWPQSLRTTLAILLNSKFPMLLWWGDDLIQFYNDAYRPSLGDNGKHPGSLGQNAKDCWKEIWPIIKPLIDQVKLRGESTWSENQLVPIFRNGRIEDVYWTFSYSPVCNEDGKVEGILVVCTETTNQINTLKKLEDSEERSRLAIDAGLLGTFDVNISTDKIICSKRFCEIFGIGENNISHKQLINAIHPDDLQVRNEAFEKAAKKDTLAYQVRIIWPDKTIHWIGVRGKIFHDEENKPTRILGIARDITDQKMFAEELERKIRERTTQLKNINEEFKKSEEKYHLMVEQVQDYAIIFLNKNGIIENWNIGAEKIKGYKAEEIIGKNFSVFYTEEDQKSSLPKKLLNEAITNGRASYEGWRVRKDGSIFWGNVVLTALLDDKKNVVGFSKVTRDLTEKKKADDILQENAAKLEEKNRELEKMNKELESFAYVSSHDLQEPLRKIQTFASLILEKENQNLSTTGKDYFRRMQVAAMRMQLLIDDLLSYSRAGTAIGTFAITDLSEIINEVKKELKEIIEEKKAAITSNGTCKIKIIPFQFRQLMFNLIHNSLKFSKPNLASQIQIDCELIKGSIIKILGLSEEKNYWRITITDNGIGFDQIYAHRIFEVFQRLHGKDEYEGSGVGLAIVKKIVENHNGMITATSEPEKGARFEIYLPEE